MLRIKIEGEAKMGKTRALAAVVTALEDAGFTVTFNDDDVRSHDVLESIARQRVWPPKTVHVITERKVRRSG